MKLCIERTTCRNSCSKCDESWDLIASADDGFQFCVGTIRAGNDDRKSRGVAARLAELWNDAEAALEDSGADELAFLEGPAPHGQTVTVTLPGDIKVEAHVESGEDPEAFSARLRSAINAVLPALDRVLEHRAVAR